MSTRDRYNKDILKALQSIAKSCDRIADCLERMTISTKDYSESVSETLTKYKMEDGRE